MTSSELETPQRLTARRRVAAVLTEEILNNPQNKDFLIGSEQELCSRFSVSRVTIRLALGDLENRRLIYRRHGKGTFAYGCLNRVYRSLGLLLASPNLLKSPLIGDFISGAHQAAAAHKSSLVLVFTSPLDWQIDLLNTIGGVVVIDKSLLEDELNIFKMRGLPYTCISDSQLTASESNGFQLGVDAATALYHASLTGAACDFPELERVTSCDANPSEE